MTEHFNPEKTAAKRLQHITSLQDPSLHHSKLVELKKEISRREHTSYRTISRYLTAYYQKGFAELKPKTTYHHKDSELPPDFLELLEAITLRRECPTWSAHDIIWILELEDRVALGVLCGSTP